MNNVSKNMRVYHRYLGFFLAGIMAIYSISGIILIFRDTPYFKKDIKKVLTLSPNMNKDSIGPAIKIKNLKITKVEGNIISFEQGTYNSTTGVANYSVKELPYIISKMTSFHKASVKQPLFYFNIFFGCSLLFFVVSSFWMFMPSTTIFKKGLYFTIAGIVLSLLLLFV